ncbi:cobalt-zinc-cadmium resistance protein, partial [Klebsiella pneumoniae]|uniref:TolC family protein n=1 Tax=Klebsiella pneumoniae TaxID=573 RepID=UPI00275EA380|nr:cobalt-zinc-cadmium resistance protein [Klebsiella pneumoniae]
MKRAQEVGRNQLVFGISIPLPVLDTNRGNQIQALRLADQAEEKLQALRVQMQTDVFQAREQLETSRRLAQQLSTQVLPTAQT